MSNDTSSKHTPGPWNVERPYMEPGIYVAGPNTGLIAKMFEPDKVTTNNGHPVSMDANASLIAAAPDMLEALRDAATMLEDAKRYFPKSIMNRDTFRLHNVLANSVNPAIAKAKGEQDA